MKWISVEERMPEECEDVLVFEKYISLRCIKIGHFMGIEEPFWVDLHCYPVDKVTHWMSLPKGQDE